MENRRSLCREVALQVLYMQDQNPALASQEIQVYLYRRLADPHMCLETRELVDGVLAHQKALDAIITGFARNWRLDRMAAIDRNILRLGAEELMHCPRIPVKVAISEAVELAKRFSTAQSSRFVNGILNQLQHLPNFRVPAPASDSAPDSAPASASASASASEPSLRDRSPGGRRLPTGYAGGMFPRESDGADPLTDDEDDDEIPSTVPPVPVPVPVPVTVTADNPPHEERG